MPDLHQNSIHAAVRQQIELYDMAQKKDRWLLAVSGGADSMALTHLLHQLHEQGRLEIAGLVVAHLNHGLRGQESDADAEFVRQQCRHLNLKCIVGTADVSSQAQIAKESIELTARQLRYRFLADTAREEGCRIIATAHNSDDQVETLLHRITRGTGIRGLAGIPARRQTTCSEGNPLEIVRPLLAVRRQHIEAFMREHQHPYRLDSSNLSKTPTRNRIRHDLLPMLVREFNPNVFDALQRLALTAEWMTLALACDVERDYQACLMHQDAHTIHLARKRLAELPMIQQAEIINRALQYLKVSQQPIGQKHILAVLRKLSDPESTSWRHDWPDNLQIRCNERHLTFVLQSKNNGGCPHLETVELAVPGRTVLPVGFRCFARLEANTYPLNTFDILDLTAEPERLQPLLTNKDDHEEFIDRDRLVGSLTLRTWRNGERFQPLGAPGEKTLGDFFTDHKIPLPDRSCLGLIADEQGVVWVAGLRITDRVKITSETRRVLHMRFS